MKFGNAEYKGCCLERTLSTSEAQPMSHHRKSFRISIVSVIAALGFLKNHVASRWILAGFFLSHAVGAVMVLGG